jgi:hypothetical protein
MNKKWIWILVCVVSGLLLLFCGFLMPVHLRALDVGVVQKAGRKTPSLIQQGMALVSGQNLGVARLFLQVAQSEAIGGREQLTVAVANAVRQHPECFVWGNDSTLARLFENSYSSQEVFTKIIVRQKNRRAALEMLRTSPNPIVQELLQCRALTNTVLFPSSTSTAGQAFDAVVAISGLLLVEGRLATGLSDEIGQLAAAANRGNGSMPLEQVLMDLLLLGQQFNWDQLVAFVGRIEDSGTLHTLVEQVRHSTGPMPVLFSAVVLSGKPAAVAKYITEFDQTAYGDLAAGLRYGTGGLNELLNRQQMLYRDRSGYTLALSMCWQQPGLAFVLKWLAYLSSGFLLALTLHLVQPPVTARERALQVRGFHVIRESMFALGFLLVVLLLSEPFLTQDTRKEEFTFRLQVPMTGHAVPVGFASAHPNIMNNMILLTLLLFFVLQGLIYVSCLVKLAEIRRQNSAPRMKLRLLDNEDHLFDAGLYLGFVGTILSLIMVSMGLIKFSLMAAYSSTCFGIIFVCVFKIFNLRPARRRLLMEIETVEAIKPKR